MTQTHIFIIAHIIFNHVHQWLYKHYSKKKKYLFIVNTTQQQIHKLKMINNIKHINNNKIT